jgi:KaiC/GvpD/RAD55 family RecA-like ATPase
MIIDKKYLTPKYLSILCIGLLRYDINNFNDPAMLNISNFLNYFFTTKNQPYNTLSLVYETDNPIYLNILSLIIESKTVSVNADIITIQQNIINKIENTTDTNTFNKVQKFINYIIDNKDSNNFNSSSINVEFDKVIKYLSLYRSIIELNDLYSKFYTINDPTLEYEKKLSSIFLTYDDSLINDDFVLSNDEKDIDTALQESAVVQEECRVVSILEEIRFIEKKRIGILVGASGSGKSMFLCHSTAEHLRIKKNNSKKNIIFYFTFENSKTETFIRIIANITNIDINKLKHDILDETKRKKIIELYLSYKDDDTVLVIVELPPKRHNMLAIEACIDRTLLKFKDSIVYSIMLDYVDKMLPIDNRKTLRSDEVVGNIVDDFKAISKKYDTCGLTVSQFNREGARKAKSDDELATGTDIGGGWSKYENADIVITMQVKDTYKDLGYNMVVLYNEKHRYHEDGTVIHCRYRPNLSKFERCDIGEGGAMEGQFEKRTMSNRQVSQSVSLF